MIKKHHHSDAPSKCPLPIGMRLRAAAAQGPIGSILLLAATITALLWANSAFADSYFQLRGLDFGIADFTIAGHAVHGIMLPLGQWASDGLLTLFFFIAGLELKQECTTGDLKEFSRAIVPITAALGGVVAPALLYFLLNAQFNPEASHGWAIPTATDIAFAVSALALVGSLLPAALRTFLLTLAVIDDLVAIVIIAVFYSDGLRPGYLAAAAASTAFFALIVRRGIGVWFVLLPLAVLTWYFVHEAGIHATIAGVLLSFTVPTADAQENASAPQPLTSPRTAGVASRARQAVEPLSTFIAVPLFALFSAGIALHGWKGITSAFGNVLTLGIVAALVLGKALGVLTATFAVTRLTSARLHDSLKWPDLIGLAFLTGIGFTVSLLLSELSFGTASVNANYAKIGVLTGSLISAAIGMCILTVRNRRYGALRDGS